MTLQVVILAAGQGTRMQSSLPKVLHQLGGKPMLQHVIEIAHSVSPNIAPMVIYGHQGTLLQETFKHENVRFVEQAEQLGTGHAMLCALPTIDEKDQVLILSGDVPLMSASTLQRLIAATPANAIGMLTAILPDANGYGRIVRDKQHHVIAIVEQKDATPQELSINEINPGVYLVPATYLKKWLPMLSNQNAQKEYYLTDIIAMAVKAGISIHDVQPEQVAEISGINDRVQLSLLERCYQRQQAEKWMRRGVTILDPARFDVRGEVTIGRDVVIDVNVILEGNVVISDQCVIGPNCLLRNTELASGVEIKANSVIDGAEIESGCIIGPFARVRPGTIMGESVHIGNFVEVKNSVVRANSKVNHLSYIGDSDIGKHVNVGAGTITCNYDGAAKHKTQIGDHVHIGSGTQLVAPLVIGDHATIGAGSTVTKDAPPNQLTLTHRLEQRVADSWVRPTK